MVKHFPFERLKAPAYTCPSGEQIENGTFETGAATGWYLREGVIQTGTVHGGTYAAQVYPSGTRQLFQTLNNQMPVSCVQSFDVWLYQASLNVTNIQIHYTDGSYTNYAVSGTGAWQNVDLKANLAAGKIIKQLLIINGYISDLYVDDVSLIGTG